MAHVSRASIINRQDCCLDRIRCYQLQLLTSLNQTLMVLNFTTIASSYDLRDVATPEGQAACVARPPHHLPPHHGPPCRLYLTLLCALTLPARMCAMCAWRGVVGPPAAT